VHLLVLVHLQHDVVSQGAALAKLLRHTGASVDVTAAMHSSEQERRIPAHSLGWHRQAGLCISMHAVAEPQGRGAAGSPGP